jgi:hypothetical protein
VRECEGNEDNFARAFAVELQYKGGFPRLVTYDAPGAEGPISELLEPRKLRQLTKEEVNKIVDSSASIGSDSEVGAVYRELFEKGAINHYSYNQIVIGLVNRFKTPQIRKTIEALKEKPEIVRPINITEQEAKELVAEAIQQGNLDILASEFGDLFTKGIITKEAWQLVGHVRWNTIIG